MAGAKSGYGSAENRASSSVSQLALVNYNENLTTDEILCLKTAERCQGKKTKMQQLGHLRLTTTKMPHLKHL